MHISINGELEEKLEAYATNRKTSKSDALRNGFQLLVNSEYHTERQETIVRVAIDQHFSVPAYFSHKAFMLMLGLLALKNGNDSSRHFWGSSVYVSTVDKTHHAIYTEIQDTMRRLAGKTKKETPSKE